MTIPAEIIEPFTHDYQNLSYRQLAKKYGKGEGTVRRWATEVLKLPPRQISRKGENGEVLLPMPKSNDPVAVKDMLRNLIALQKSQHNLSDVVSDISISINTDKPIGVLFWGDWHLGGYGTDHEEFLRVLEAAQGTPGLYVIGMGDYKDNMGSSPHKDKGAHNEEILRPSMQDKLVADAVKELKDKFLVLLRGCHDDWDHQSSDRDFVSYLSEMAGCANMGHGGALHLSVGPEGEGNEYILRLRHVYPFKSSTNPGNPQRKQVDMQGESDIVAHAHLHFAHIDQSVKAGREWIGIRSGSHKVIDEYGQKLAGWEGMQRFPMVILSPGTQKKEMIPFWDFKQGLALLKYNRLNTKH
jgi:hypothetical protein